MSMIIVWRFFVELSFSFCDSDGAGLFAYRVLWLSAECDNGNNASSLLELICRLFPRCERANSKVKMLLHRKHSSAYTLTAKAVKTLNKKLQLATAVFFSPSISLSLSLECFSFFEVRNQRALGIVIPCDVWWNNGSRKDSRFSCCHILWYGIRFKRHPAQVMW